MATRPSLARAHLAQRTVAAAVARNLLRVKPVVQAAAAAAVLALMPGDQAPLGKVATAATAAQVASLAGQVAAVVAQAVQAAMLFPRVAVLVGSVFHLTSLVALNITELAAAAARAHMARSPQTVAVELAATGAETIRPPR